MHRTKFSFDVVPNSAPRKGFFDKDFSLHRNARRRVLDAFCHPLSNASSVLHQFLIAGSLICCTCLSSNTDEMS
jgi:hypothetical protein